MHRTSTRNYRQWGYIGFNGDGSDTLRVPHGEPYAGNLHVRFDEGAGVPDNKGRPALLYTLFVNMEFLAEIAKIVPQGDTTFSPCEKIYFAPPEEKRFSKSF